MKKFLSILICLLIALSASASNSRSVTKKVASVCSISSGNATGDIVSKPLPHSYKEHTFIKKNGLRVRYMKAEIRYTLSYFTDPVVYYPVLRQVYTTFYSDPYYSDHHRLSKLRGPPATSAAQA